MSEVEVSPGVELGIDVLKANNFKGLEGKRIGLITNPSGVSRTGRSTVEVLNEAPQINLVALFAPEHGIYGDDLAGEKVAKKTDARTGLPVYSLYESTRQPTPEMLKDLDVLMYDIQDIGCRSYTYISTLGLAMEAAGKAGIDFFVLDRPNPLNGLRVEGPPLDPAFRSFVGQWEVPYVYGLTVGELARMINTEKWIKTRPKLIIVPMRGWSREMSWKDTGLLWIPTSPQIPTAETAYYYVITGWIGEGLSVNHGIGYTLPFQLLGRPDFHAFDMTDRLSSKKIPGVVFRPVFYKTFWGTYAGKVSQGVHILLSEPKGVNLCHLAVGLLEDLIQQKGKEIFSKKALQAKSLFQKVCGGDTILKHFLEGKSAETLVESWEPSLQAFREKRKLYLIYPEASPKNKK